MTPNELQITAHINIPSSYELHKVLCEVQKLDSILKMEENRQPAFVYKIIKEQKLRDFTIEDIKNVMIQSNISYNYNFIKDDLEDLLVEKKLEQTNNIFNKFVPSLLEVIENISDERDRYVVLEAF